MASFEFLFRLDAHHLSSPHTFLELREYLVNSQNSKKAVRAFLAGHTGLWKPGPLRRCLLLLFSPRGLFKM